MYCIDVILLIALNNYTAAVAIPSLLIVDYNLTFAWINRSQTLCLHLNKYSIFFFLTLMEYRVLVCLQNII